MSNTVNHSTVAGSKFRDLLEVFLTLQFSKLFLLGKKKFHPFSLLIVDVRNDEILDAWNVKRSDTSITDRSPENWERRTHHVSRLERHLPVWLLGVGG